METVILLTENPYIIILVFILSSAYRARTFILSNVWTLK